MATEVQTQDDQLLVDHSLVDDGVEEEEEDEKEDEEEEEDGEDEKLEDILDFPNFYSMAADMMNQLNGDIPEVMLYHKNDTFV